MNDYSGHRFGRLVAVVPVGRNRWRNVLWRCKCDCGNLTVVSSSDIKRTSSCGCIHSEITSERTKTHGESHTKLYKIWAAMKQRCRNPNNKRYADYGGRGIDLCDRWMDYPEFAEWARQNGYKAGVDIDRRDNGRGYSPENCRFVTRTQNCRNKRDNVFLEFRGDRKTIAEWAEVAMLPQKLIQGRKRRGWSDEETLALPPGTRKSALPPHKIHGMVEAWSEKKNKSTGD